VVATIPIASDHDRLEQIWGWSQFGGALLALAAVILAGISAWHARKAAGSADRTASVTNDLARTAQEELELVKREMNRKPDLRLVVDTIDPYDERYFDDLPSFDRGSIGVGTNSAGLQVGLVNGGDADAPGTVINLIAPPQSRFWKWSTAAGEGEASMFTHATGREFDDFPFAVYAIDIVDVRRKIATVVYYRVEFPSTGEFPMRISVSHPDSHASESLTFEVS
jgi:hypothetical protein